jgi:hypothetical protein
VVWDASEEAEGNREEAFIVYILNERAAVEGSV